MINYPLYGVAAFVTVCFIGFTLMANILVNATRKNERADNMYR